MFKEYPKCVYLGGNVEADYRVVFDADAETAAREDDYVPANVPPVETEPVEAEPVEVEPVEVERVVRAYNRKPKAK